MISDGEDEDPALVPSGKALELLQTEKVCHSGYLLKKGEKRRVRSFVYFIVLLYKNRTE